MSDKYSIDDILAEVDHKRGDTPKSTESVTEIIGDELKGYVHPYAGGKARGGAFRGRGKPPAR